jgi:hypothetical protein
VTAGKKNIERGEERRERVHLMHYRFPGPVGYLFPDSVASSADASHTGGEVRYHEACSYVDKEAQPSEP